MRLSIAITTLTFLLCATAQAQPAPSYEDTINVPVVVDFPGPPIETGNSKQFTLTAPVSIVGRQTLLSGKGGPVLGKILKARVTLTNNPDGSVQMGFAHVSLSGEHEDDISNGYTTGFSMDTELEPNRGGLSWTVEIYDATSTQPIYRWNSKAEGVANEEVQCGVFLERRSSFVIRGNALSPQEIFRRAARLRATAAPAEWAHCGSF